MSADSLDPGDPDVGRMLLARAAAQLGDMLNGMVNNGVQFAITSLSAEDDVFVGALVQAEQIIREKLTPTAVAAGAGFAVDRAVEVFIAAATEERARQLAAGSEGR